MINDNIDPEEEAKFGAQQPFDPNNPLSRGGPDGAGSLFQDFPGANNPFYNPNKKIAKKKCTEVPILPLYRGSQ